MKIRVYFCALLFLFSVSSANAVSRLTAEATEVNRFLPELHKSVRVREIKSCLAEKEAGFAQTPAFDKTDDRETLENVNEYVAQIDELLGCVNQGLKINNLSWRVRREWLHKKFEYHSVRQVFAQYSCYFANIIRAANLSEATLSKVRENDKIGAARMADRLRFSALKAKSCSERALRFKHIDAELKDGFREISGKTNGMLKEIEKLQSVVKEMPE